MMGSQFDSVDIASNTISENELLESGGNENQQGKSVDEQNDQLPNKRKWYHRHTLHQIQEMEAFFKEYPHPDDKQRMELSSRLGLESLQVKFWFQNKRTQMKNLFERHENSLLRAEIDKFKAENVLLSEALSNGCPNCGGPTFCLGEMPYEKNQLMLENAHQPDEVDRILEAEKLIIIETAVAAMEEFIQMAQMGEPLWLPSIYRGTNFLNEEEYMRIFRRGSEPKPQGIKIEASREIAVVIMNHHNLVEIFMDVNNWSSLFFNIVSKTITLDVLSTEVAGNLDGIIKMIYAEFQVPSPQVPTRDCYFIRYCKRVVDGVWAIVDVSLDHTPITRCRKRPSGCLIQEMPNGYSKVTWIEHIEVDDESIHNIYKPLIDSGLAFGAKRWVATLDRQCERLASALATNVHQNDIRHMHQEGRRSVLKLAERMVISYCSGVSAAATAHQWTALRGNGSGIYDVRFMTRQSIDDPGRPHGIVLSASTSFWLPISPKTVFDFLLHENSRKKWDILSNGGDVQEVAHIAVNSRNTGNRVSFLRVNNLKSAENMLILQESSTDPTGSFVVYSAVDVPAINIVLSGGNPDHVPLLSSGFAILPDGPSSSIDGRVADSSGSLLTIAFQILVDKIPTAEVSLEAVAMVNNLIYGTIDKIKIALLSDTP